MHNVQRYDLLKSLLAIFLCLKPVNSQRIKLAEVESLTFYKDRTTVGRRFNPVAQLQCESKLRLLSYTNCYKFQPAVVQCFNRGQNGQWECKADLDKRVQFSDIKVSCEGYDYSNDPFVLYGSCWLKYSLETKTSKNFNEYYHRDLYETNKLSNFLAFLIMIVILIAVYRSCKTSREMSNVATDNRFTQVGCRPEENINPVLPVDVVVFPPPPPPWSDRKRSESPPPAYEQTLSAKPNEEECEKKDTEYS